MSKLAWKPWHQVVELRPDVRSGDLSLSQFAADLYDVVMDRGTAVYRTPAEFFALTFPTYNLRELAKDVVHRLAGKNDKTDPPVGTDLRRRQDAHPDHPAAPGPATRGACPTCPPSKSSSSTSA